MLDSPISTPLSTLALTEGLPPYSAVVRQGRKQIRGQRLVASNVGVKWEVVTWTVAGQETIKSQVQNCMFWSFDFKINLKMCLKYSVLFLGTSHPAQLSIQPHWFGGCTGVWPDLCTGHCNPGTVKEMSGCSAWRGLAGQDTILAISHLCHGTLWDHSRSHSIQGESMSYREGLGLRANFRQFFWGKPR